MDPEVDGQVEGRGQLQPARHEAYEAGVQVLHDRRHTLQQSEVACGIAVERPVAKQDTFAATLSEGCKPRVWSVFRV